MTFLEALDQLILGERIRFHDWGQWYLKQGPDHTILRISTYQTPSMWIPQEWHLTESWSVV